MLSPLSHSSAYIEISHVGLKYTVLSCLACETTNHPQNKLSKNIKIEVGAYAQRNIV